MKIRKKSQISIILKLLSVFLFGIFLFVSFNTKVSADDNPNGCGKYALQGAPNNHYEAGFYSGRLLKDDVTEQNFCLVGYLYPDKDQAKYNEGRNQASIQGGQRTWTCRQLSSADDKDLDTCTARVLPPENTSCLRNNVAYDKKPLGSNLKPLCKKADAHGFVDPGFPSVSEISGGDDNPWTRTCGGQYYNDITCKAPSKGKCMDTKNMMYDELEESEEICENGKSDGFKFNEEKYKRERTCKGSEEKYDVQCSAQRTTERGECSFIYNNKTLDNLNTGMELCTKGTIDYDSFVFSETDKDSTFGWSWTCKGSTESLNDKCFTHKTVSKGICNPTFTSASKEKLGTGDDLCKVGEMTGLQLNEEKRQREWTCQGSRPKDNTQCTTKLKVIEGKCGGKNGTLCEELTQESDGLCEQGIATDWHWDEEFKKRKWNCIGNPKTLSVQCSAKKTEAGLCNEEVNGKTMTYENIVKHDLCKGGATDIVLKEQTVGGIWNWTCKGLGGGSGDQCSVNQYQTGSCANLIGMVKTLPTQLCKAGKPVSTKIVNGFWVRTCEGYNKAPSTQCTIECIDGKCETGNGAGICKNGEYCDKNHPCKDGSICQGGGDGNDIPDGIIPEIGPGEICNDIDGCMCGENRIFNGTICKGGYTDDENDPKNPNYRMPIFRPTLDPWGSLYDESMMLPGNADLIIDHKTQTGVAHKKENIRFDIFYKNDGPDTAYGTYVAYKYSDLLENIKGSIPFTVVTLSSVIDNDKKIQKAVKDKKEETDKKIEDSTKKLESDNLSGSSSTGDNTTGELEKIDKNEEEIPLDVNKPGSLNANNESKTDNSESSTTKTYSDIYKNVIYFYVGTLEPGQTGKITFTGTVKNTLSGTIVTNTAQIQSRLNDPNKLNNTKSASVNLELILMSSLDAINPLLYMKPVLDRRNSIVKRINAKTDFRDVIIGYPWYMHIMTVQKNNLMKGYEYKYSTMFMPKKCISRAEYLIVMARIMHIANTIDDDSVYNGDLQTTPYIDVPTNNKTNVKYINRAHKRGLIDIFKAGKNMKNILGVNKPVQHKEGKAVLYRLYKIMNADTKVLKPLLVGTGNNFSDKCLTREETAYTVAHILRGNENVVMGFNDIFMSKLYDFLLPKSIMQRRDLLSRLIFKMRQISPGNLFKLGLDKETLIGVLGTAMRGKIYQPIHDSSSVKNFFYEVSDDEYDRYIKNLYK